jgi:hypothetical protein
MVLGHCGRKKAKTLSKTKGNRKNVGEGGKSVAVVSVVEDLIIRPMRRQTL